MLANDGRVVPIETNRTIYAPESTATTCSFVSFNRSVTRRVIQILHIGRGASHILATSPRLGLELGEKHHPLSFCRECAGIAHSRPAVSTHHHFGFFFNLYASPIGKFATGSLLVDVCVFHFWLVVLCTCFETAVFVSFSTLQSATASIGGWFVVAVVVALERYLARVAFDSTARLIRDTIYEDVVAVQCGFVWISRRLDAAGNQPQQQR